VKILFLTLYPSFASSSRFRIVQYLGRLEADGFEVQIIPAVSESTYRSCAGTGNVLAAMRYYAEEFLTRLATLLRKSDHDIVVLQKGILSFWSRGMERFLTKFKDRLVFDLDDAIHLRAPNNLPRFLRFLEADRQPLRIMEISRSVIVANEELAVVPRSLSKSVHVIPTAVDTDYFSHRPAASGNPSPLRLLWMGNRSSNSCVNEMSYIMRILKDRGVKTYLTVLSDSKDFIRFEDFEGGPLRHVPWSYGTEKAELASAHVGVMPAADNPWNRAKSGFKTMLYMGCGLPSVSAPVGSITRVVRHGENGFFAGSQEEWVDILSRLSMDAELRGNVGRKARETVERDYSVAALYPSFKRALLSVTELCHA
jgi:glycosyltransferase involved in cell wall biosynthesis